MYSVVRTTSALRRWDGLSSTTKLVGTGLRHTYILPAMCATQRWLDPNATPRRTAVATAGRGRSSRPSATRSWSHVPSLTGPRRTPLSPRGSTPCWVIPARRRVRHERRRREGLGWWSGACACRSRIRRWGDHIVNGGRGESTSTARRARRRRCLSYQTVNLTESHLHISCPRRSP